MRIVIRTELSGESPLPETWVPWGSNGSRGRSPSRRQNSSRCSGGRDAGEPKARGLAVSGELPLLMAQGFVGVQVGRGRRYAASGPGAVMAPRAHFQESYPRRGRRFHEVRKIARTRAIFPGERQYPSSRHGRWPTRRASRRYISTMEPQDNEHRPAEPLPAFSEDGVDLTLIRWMLSLTPDERLQHLEDHAAFAEELRHANASVQVPYHP